MEAAGLEVQFSHFPVFCAHDTFSLRFCLLSYDRNVLQEMLFCESQAVAQIMNGNVQDKEHQDCVFLEGFELVKA
jgi:hypothetical protein